MQSSVDRGCPCPELEERAGKQGALLGAQSTALAAAQSPPRLRGTSCR